MRLTSIRPLWPSWNSRVSLWQTTSSFPFFLSQSSQIGNKLHFPEKTLTEVLLLGSNNEGDSLFGQMGCLLCYKTESHKAQRVKVLSLTFEADVTSEAPICIWEYWQLLRTYSVKTDLLWRRPFNLFLQRCDSIFVTASPLWLSAEKAYPGVNILPCLQVWGRGGGCKHGGPLWLPRSLNPVEN